MTINCGNYTHAQDMAVGIAVAASTPAEKCENVVIDGCHVIGSGYGGIGVLNTKNCVITNCVVDDCDKIGIGVIGSLNTIVTNNIVIRTTQGNPQAGEFGILLNDDNKTIVTNNILENAHIVRNNSSNNIVENNIGDII